MGKGENNGYFGNCCSLRPESCCRQLMESMKVSNYEGQCHFLTLTQGHLNTKIKIMVFSEITGFGNYCSMRPETLQMQTTNEVN